jgi:carbon-monoxide dehydrogenase large subunit
VAHAAYYNPVALPPGDLPGLEVTSSYEPPRTAFYSGTHVAVVDVDTATGHVKVLRYLAVTDCGTAVNPTIVEGQVIGGVVQGLGGVLFEEMAYAPDGSCLTDTFSDYMLPMAADLPRIEVEFLTLPPDMDLPYGAKPVGEGGVVGAAPAIINAIADALSPWGVSLTQQPLTPDKLRQLLRQTGH